MNDLLEELHKLAIEFRKIQMKQTAGDYDYLVAWLRSPMWTKNGEHLKPNPAGKNTVDAYSHNCPIPYYASAEIFNKCTDDKFAEVFLTQARELLFELALEYIEDDEKIAIDAYIEYTDELITILTGEQPEPPGPEPTPEKRQGICGVITETSDDILQNNPQNKMTNNGIGFTGELSVGIIPESGIVEEYVQPAPVPEGILLGVKYREGQGFTAEAFTRNGAWWWAGFVDQAGKDEALALGCATTTASDCPCPLGVLCCDTGYTYEVLGLYSDVEGTIPVTEFDLADFSIELDYIPAYGSPATIRSSKAYPSDVKAMTYRIKITKK